MAAAESFRQFLGAFCSQNATQPSYTGEDEGDGFYCEVGGSILVDP